MNDPARVQAFKQTQNNDLFDQWRQCWSQVGSEVKGDLAIAERDVEGARAQAITDGLLATVVINDQHYRGSLDAVCSLSPMSVLLQFVAHLCLRWLLPHHYARNVCC